MKKVLFTAAALLVATSASAMTVPPVLAVVESVPDGGATMALLGGAVAGLGALRYFMGK
ncbi:hypothetical protein TBR22_A52900 [Luteitalea sp. TBR-22]|uniref:VPDSG-CTERM sorting domain-containing protein n=1 Tax=Luteitalea sp. TBR-22 TaxID=2802971 RepID=UPI001AF8447D|nr:VPDSG-CTERM sorting domain-containing protein [Luteitalea sp. TBR-22]BCS36053.1 hypothetical protein TBR22_A52900 [Luteitalea sp. TBR-22]